MPVFLRSEVDTPFDHSIVTHTAEQLLQLIKLEESELSVLLVSDSRIAELNAAYRHKSIPTNILSFPMLDENDSPGPQLLGDMVISVETAIREAHERNIPIENYLTILQVHGLAHLLGYDHEKGKDEAREMADFERKLLSSLNMKHKNPLTI